MIKLLRVTGATVFDKLKRLKVKVTNGAQDVRTAIESSPYGFESNPIEGMIALYAKSEVDGKEAIVGYFNVERIAQVGESRIYSTDKNGTLKMWLHLKNNGTAEFGGNTKHMVRYEELETAFNQLRSDFNSLVSKYNSHTHAYVAPLLPAPVQPGATGPVPVPQSPSAADVSGAKITQIKTL